MKHLNKIICLLLCIAVTNMANAQTTGTVFRDLNGNGTRQASAPNEPLVKGIIVNAYNSNDALIASYTTTIAGTFSIPLTGSTYNGTPGSNTGSVANAAVIRLEFIIPASGACGLDPNIDYSSGNGSTVGSSVRFVTGGTTAITYAIHKPSDFLSTTNPMVYMSRHTNGNPLGGGTSGTANWFVGFPYNTTGSGAPTLALNGTAIGATWGVAYSRQAGKVFTSAFLKRHSGLGVLGSGGIYLLTPTATSFTVVNFYDMDAVANGGAYRTRADAAAAPPAYGSTTSFSLTGSNTIINYLGSTDAASGKPVGMGVIGTNVNRGLPASNTLENWDPAAFDQVGKVGLGDLEISDDGKYLFSINLYDRKVYRLELNNAYNPTSVVAVTSYALPATTVTNGVLRPFGAKFYRGKLYVGAVATAENAGTAANLRAYVFELNNAATSPAFTATPVINYALNYVKGSAMTWTGPYGLQWYPWSNNTTTTVGTGTNRTYPTPVLANIEFDDRGDMIMSFFDRGGHQWSEDNYQDLAVSTTLMRYAVGGDVLVAGSNCNGTFTIENNGAYTSSDGSSYNSGVANNQGVGTSEFFKGDNFGTTHSETAIGGLGFLRGSGELFFGTMDPLAINSGGVKRLSMATGQEVASSGYQLAGGSIAGFGKAMSLGDIEFFGTEAPVEIGNRLWNDANGNGIQDAGEAGIQNVSLELYADFNNDGIPDGAVLATTITTATGEWYFNNGNITDGDPGTAGNQPGLKYGAGYIVRVAAVDWNGATGSGIADLAGFQLTQKDKVGNGQIDLSDSDGDLSSGGSTYPQIQFIAGDAGENNHNLDFGFKPLASLGDKVWRDDDLDGIQDAGEPGVAGITVTLYDNLGNVAGTTVTDAYGFYLFDNLAAGTYQVGFTAPANYNFTTQTNNTDNTVLTSGSTAANGSDVNATTGRTANIVLTAGENERNIDAGLIFSQPINNSIGDRVWLDTDGGGTQNGTEPGISGVTVTLYAADGVTIVATGVTDANGNYIFTGLPATTNYIVGITLPAGLTYTSTSGTTTGNATINSDVSITTGKTALINTGAAGNQITGIDAGVILTNNATASLGDKVWIDLPGGTANVQDAGEPGLAGVTVNLYRDANADGLINGAEATTPYATAVTNAFGNYIFNNLPALAVTGTVYQVKFVLPGGYTFVTINTGSDDFKNSDADVAGLTKLYKINQGQRNLSVDAGVTQNAPAGTARFGDRVWFDANSNGVQDAAEPDVAGVTVTLYNSGGTAIATTTTNANGYYQFINLAAATYSVGFSNLPSGYSFTASTGTTSANATTNSDVNPGTGRTAGFAILAGQSLQGLDAGLIAGLASGLGSIGNKVWYDLPGGTTGIQEAGELGVAGVSVTLLDAGFDGIVGNGDDGASRTTTTNALGEYIFTGLPAGNYAVQFSNLPGSYTVTTSNAGIDDALDSDGGAVGTGGAPAGASRTGVYNLATGEDNLTVDLGLTPPANTNTLGNYVWFDKNSDGIQDAIEQGLAGVMVTLYNNAGTAIAFTTTNANGEYLFTGLADGNYSTGFTNLPAGFDFTTASLTNTATGSDADRTSGRTATVTLNAGNRNDRSLDAGLISSRAALGNYVWMDSNGDGVQTVGEASVPGVTVTLFRPDFGLDGIAGNGDDALPVASMITDQNGQYLFENLLPGTYQVAFTTIPTGITFTQQDTGGNDNLDSDVNPATGLTGNIVLAAGDINLTVDAGLFKPRAVIGNYVWADKNDNGVQDAGEPGYAGILVTLFDGGGNPVATTVTDADGIYLFPNVAPGTYSLVFTNLPTGVSFTIPDAGGNDNLDSDVIGTSITGIVVTTTTVNLSFDAGLNNAITLASKIEFTAYRKNTTAELNWKMGTDINEVKEFIVERSATGSSFAAIVTVSADNRTTYQQIDLQPNTGINYYRIKIIYLTGAVKYSEVRVLNFDSKGNITVFPNPVTDIINIQLPDNWQGKALSIDLINQTGQMVNSKSTKQASQVERLDVSQLAAGIYLLRIQDSNGNVQTTKVSVH
ncbi:MAG: SdrD B-like domain-containing protein [Ferruginibacter sp.]